MIDTSAVGSRPTVESFKSNTAALFKTFGKKSLPMISGSAAINHYHPLLGSLSFLSLEKTVICIDDFERKGSNIAAQDILGLITQLKEQKKCKVVLILNDESLSAGSSSDYIKLREKVIDTELRFAPTSEDCVAIALSGDKIAAELGANVIKLGISNIRIIKKIETLAALLQPLLKAYEPQVISRAMRALTILSWCYYGQSNNTPNYSFVVGRNSAFADINNDVALTTQQQSWCAILRNYDNYSVADFDLQIARLVENGYVDEKNLLAEADRVNEEVLAARSEDSFQEAWCKFNDSFAANDQEVVDCLAASFKHNARYISPTNLDGTVRLLRYLGRGKMATKIIELYVDKRGSEAEIFNLDASTITAEIGDLEVIARFKEKYESVRTKRTLRQICDYMLANDGDCEAEEILLSQVEVGAFVQLFKTLQGGELSNCVDMCLKFSQLGGMSEQQRTISDQAAEALKIIGKESKLNASRVRRFGIRVDRGF